VKGIPRKQRAIRAVKNVKRVEAAPPADVVSIEQITQSILVFRGHKVLLDSDLAELYGVPTKRLNEQVTRNAARFPPDFMFRLTPAEYAALRSQIATLNDGGRGQHRKYLPYAFTEHGAIQAANVLNSPRAVEMGIYAVRAFVKLRELLASNRELARRFEQLETRVEKLIAHDQALGVILAAIRKLMPPQPEPPQRPVH
jgi:hypothetical protein